MRFDMKRILQTSLFLMFISTIFAQDIVTNIRATFSDTVVYIFYDLERTADVELYVSLDNGQIFEGPLNNVSGNIGKNQEQGKRKMIVWDAYKEFGDFESDKVKFKFITDEHERSQISQIEKSGSYNGHRYVDLGLPSGTLWATCNVGANKPEEYGDYYAWGETNVKSNYSIKTYKYYDNLNGVVTKYNISPSFGQVDNIMFLSSNDDAATSKWGKGWSIPSRNDWIELQNYCKWTWSKQNGIAGYNVCGTNGNCIFLPAAGYRGSNEARLSGFEARYWSNVLNSGFERSWCAFFDSTDINVSACFRGYGCSIRPVLK